MTVFQVPSTPPLSRPHRCCPTHSDWSTLAQHLIEEFPAARPAQVVREVRDARNIVTAVGLADDEALEVVEIIVRHRLKIATGQLDDVARLDPQPRPRS